jgi:Zn-finger nucleic acid-binding protein
LDGVVESTPLVKESVPRAQQLNCPKCKTIVMLKRFSSVKKKVEIDECGKCAGVWLDAGELNQLRNEYKSEEDRRNAAEQTFNEMFNTSVYAAQKQSAESLQNAKRIANAFRFISPSYYIPGKQKWGAF